MQKFEIEFYETESGEFPAEHFILSQDVKMRAKIFRMLELLEIKGHELREPYSKPLRDGIYELRTKQGSNITRILYFFVIGRKIILTNGFTKKTRKTPSQEIETAKKYRANYLNRKEQSHAKEF